MPETLTNGYATNGHHSGYEMEDGNEFLFTSESVGEGHPGRLIWLRCENKYSQYLIKIKCLENGGFESQKHAASFYFYA